jgi:dipeptidyl aminopeptidase/acylaminoacyl peptidase
MPRRRIYLFIGFLIVIVAVAYGMYALLFKKPTEPIAEIPIEEQLGTLPPAQTGAPQGTAVSPVGALPPGISLIAEGGLTVVSPVAAVPTTGATLTSSGVAFYNRNEGKFYRMTADGNLQSLSDKRFLNVSDVTFDPAGQKAILEFPDGANVIYDFAAARQVTLPKHWEDFGFSPKGDQIVAKSLGSDPANRFLVIANADGTSARAVQELGENADKVFAEWSPNNQMVATALTGDFEGVDRRTMFFVGANNENFKSMVVEGLGYIPKWSPTGNRLLYSAASAASDYKPMLWISDASGDDIGKNRKSFAVNTWADKCTFGNSDEELYCAVPISMQRGAGLQRSVSSNIPDTVMRINTRTGVQTRIAVPEGEKTISTLMVSPDGRSLLFVDAGTGSLNKIQIAP